MLMICFFLMVLHSMAKGKEHRVLHGNGMVSCRDVNKRSSKVSRVCAWNWGAAGQIGPSPFGTLCVKLASLK